MGSQRVVRGLAVVTSAVLAVLGAGLATGPGASAAVAGDQTLSGVAAAQHQTNNEVHALATGGGVLYAGGTFTAVRAPRATTSTPRTYLAAFSTTTGVVTSFRVTLNGRVRALALSADNATLYIGGDFTTVNGVSRPRLAAVATSNGALRTGFNAAPNSRVTTLLRTGTTLYAGGDFTTVGGRAKARLAALNATTGAVLTAFTADLDARPNVLAVDTSLRRLLVGGTFTTVNGLPNPAMASVDSTTGTPQPWAAQSVGACVYSVRGIAVDEAADTAYVTSLADAPGCFEGVYRANIADGSVVWQDECAGAGQSVVLLKGQVYFASHTHDCGRMVGGFVGPRFRDDFVWYRLNAIDPATGEFGHWQPNTNAAGTTVVGPQVMTTDGTRLFVGGDFTTVNGSAQQGLTRFVPKGTDAAPATPPAPVAHSIGAGRVVVTVPGTWDRDTGVLGYEVRREDGTLVGTASVESWAFTIPQLRFTDATATPGASVRYRVRATGGTASAWSAWSAAVTVRTDAPAPLATTALATTPDVWWRLGDTTDGAAAGTQSDASGNARTATLTGATTATDGVTTGDAAVTLAGSGGAAADAAQTLGTAWTTSLWFRTTSRRGGALAGWSAAADGTGTTDRVLWLDNDGKVVTAVRSELANGQVPRPGRPVFTLVRSTRTVADGLWHQATATFDGTTLTLYVDGTAVGTAAATSTGVLTDAYLRAGQVDLGYFYSVFGANFTHTPAPGDPAVAGGLDEVASWSRALAADEVAALYVAGASGS